MKNDKYLKIILTIIAICLVWISVRDVKIGSMKLFANDGSTGQDQNVIITGFDEAAVEKAVHRAVFNAIQVSQPIRVSVDQTQTPTKEK